MDMMMSDGHHIDLKLSPTDALLLFFHCVGWDFPFYAEMVWSGFSLPFISAHMLGLVCVCFFLPACVHPVHV